MSYEPKPSLPRPIHSPVDHYDVDVETGTVTYHVVQTNGDRIRSMKNKELAETLLGFQCTTCDFDGFCKSKGKCKKQIMEWLKEEVQDG